MKAILAAALFAAAVVAAPGASAQGTVGDGTDMKALTAAVQADKKAYVASALALTDAEAKKFWPIYDAFQRDLDLANRKRNLAIEGLVARDKPLSDLYARNLLKDLLDADDAEIRARRTMQSRLMKAVPPKKAARYLQIESKIRAAQAYDIAVAFPLVK